MFIKLAYWKYIYNLTQIIYRWILIDLVRRGLSSPEVCGSRSLEDLRWRCCNVTLGGPEGPKVI